MKLISVIITDEIRMCKSSIDENHFFFQFTMPTATEAQRVALLSVIKDDYELFFGKMTFKDEKENQYLAWQRLLMLAHE